MKKIIFIIIVATLLALIPIGIKTDGREQGLLDRMYL